MSHHSQPHRAHLQFKRSLRVMLRYLLHRYALDSWDPATGSASHCGYANLEEKKRPTGINGPWTWPWWPFLFLALPGFQLGLRQQLHCLGKDSRTLHRCAAHTGLQEGRVRIIGAKYGSAVVEVREITSGASVPRVLCCATALAEHRAHDGPIRDQLARPAARKREIGAT